ncbi:MAG TPA: glycosyltransferase 87 family protein [Thermoanaerobaculia bacterium]
MPTRRAVWLLVLLFLGIYLWRNVWVVWPFLFRTGGDFANFHRSAALLLDGQSPFTPTFDYPPLLAILLLPVAWMTLDGARVAWFLVSHACLLGSAAILWRSLGGGLTALAVLGALGSLGGTVQENLALGQVNPLLLLLLAVAVRADGNRPSQGAAALGAGAGLKIWPGLLLLAYAGRASRRLFAIGIAVAVLCVALPLILIAVFLPPPHLPHGTGYWMGTPASLNVSLPALALRLSYPLSGPVPEDWIVGNEVARLHLDAGRKALSVGVSLATLALGLVALGWRARQDRWDGRFGLAALTALAILASPISWYHYQLLQFPGLALLAVSYLRRRALLPMAGLAILAAGLTSRTVRDFLLRGGDAGSVLLYGAVIAGLGVVLFILLLKEMPTGPAPSSSGTARPASPRSSS